MMITRTSRLIATIIFRKDSACASSRFPEGRLPSFVTPSTISATSSPNCSASSAFVTPVSSSTSCRSAAAMVVASSLSSARMAPVASGW
jgi:hypothetical protein